MRIIRKKYFILDRGINLRTYDGVSFNGFEYTILRSSRNNAAIKAAINFLKEVL